MTEQATIKLSDIVYRADLYPRSEPDPKTIQRYGDAIDRLPPIEVNQDRILIDGYHRWKTFETAEREEIPCIVTQTSSDVEILTLALKRNAAFGRQLSPKDKKRHAISLWQKIPDAEIIETLSVDERTFRGWTQAKREAQEEEERQAVFDLWLECLTQSAIAEKLSIAQPTVARIIDGFIQNGKFSDSDIFADFEKPESEDGKPAKSSRQLYSIWNFPKATNEVRHFGNIPPEIVENLLYYCTKPFDVVFDPFGGGGATIDVCRERKRRYYVSDLNPIPARAHQMRKHDITTGLPEDLPVPDLVFLDPPYWKQAENQYSQDPTDLGNVELDTFLDTIGNIARDIKQRKWKGDRNGTLALIIGPWKNAGKYLGLSYLCYERISKYLTLKNQIIVPYSTQVHGGAFVQKAKDAKEILYLHRDLLLFTK